MRKSAPKTVKVLLSAGYSTNPSDSVNLRRNSSAERAAASGPLSGSASVSPSALANISASSDAAREREEPSGTKPECATSTVATSCMAVFPIHFLLVALGIPTAATLRETPLDAEPRAAPLSAKQLIRHEPCAAQLRTDFTRLRS